MGGRLSASRRPPTPTAERESHDATRRRAVVYFTPDSPRRQPAAAIASTPPPLPPSVNLTTQHADGPSCTSHPTVRDAVAGFGVARRWAKRMPAGGGTHVAIVASPST